MWGFERHKAQAATILTEASQSTGVKIQGFAKISIEVPTFAIGLNTAVACIRCQVSQDNVTYRQLYANGRYSAMSGIGIWEVPAGAGGYNVVCEPVVGFKYMKVELASTNASATAAALGCVVHCFQ